MKDIDLSEFKVAFLGEAEELLNTANRELLTIENAIRKGEGHVRAVRELFRAIHTIKGLSAMVGIEPVVQIAHRLESVLRDATAASGKLSLAAVETMLQAVGAIDQRVQALSKETEILPPPASLLEALDLLEEDSAIAGADAPTSGELDPSIAEKLGPAEREQIMQGVRAGRRAVQIDFVPSPAHAEKGINITSVRERLATLAEIVKVIPRSMPVSDAAPAGLAFALVILTTETDAALAQATGGSPESPKTLAVVPDEKPNEPLPETDDLTPRDRSMVRVEVARIDEAMERMSVLIVTRYRLQRAVRDLASRGLQVRELEEALAEHGRQLRDLRAAILSVRMVPVADVLDRVPLLVRGLARTTGKQVRLEIAVGRAEVDKTVAERIFPALVHLVRNAVDHAIEAPEDRVAHGKPDKGLIRLSCVERSNTQLELTVEDDGAGVDGRAVARRAKREAPKTNAELLDLLCLPGLSTRSETTTTSGRGMGMDIVRRIVVEQLGGELTLTTRPGLGTTFVLRVPLTISIVDAFTFESGGQRLAVPVALVEEVLEIDPAKVVHAPDLSGRADRIGMLERRGETLPLVMLSKLLGRPSEESASKAFVARRNGEAIAFAIERLLGQQEIVVRPLEDALVRVPGITGSTDLGDGRPTLVVDLYALGGRSSRVEEKAA